LEAAEGRLEIEFGVGELGPARQRLAVLNLLLTPTAGVLLKIRIVVENPAQMVRVSRAIVFDEARRLDDAHHLWIELIAIKPIPRNVIKPPAAHRPPPFFQTFC
jgi:hypothetical protein